MRITWLGHACFRLSSGGYSVVVDPYEPDRVPGYGSMTAEADAVYCSHGHGDHNYVQAVTLKDSGNTPMEAEKVPSFHDDRQGTLRGENTIHVFYDGETRAVHLGDLGHLLSPEQLKVIGKPDVLMIPVGGFFTIGPDDAVKVIDQLQPRVVIPMHYRLGDLGYDEIGLLDEFLDKCDYAPVVRYGGNSIDVVPSTPKQTAVLTFERKEKC